MNYSGSFWLTLHNATPVSNRSMKFSVLILSSGYIVFSHSAKSSRIAYKYSSLDLKGRYGRASNKTVFAILLVCCATQRRRECLCVWRCVRDNALVSIVSSVNRPQVINVNRTITLALLFVALSFLFRFFLQASLLTVLIDGRAMQFMIWTLNETQDVK